MPEGVGAKNATLRPVNGFAASCAVANAVIGFVENHAADAVCRDLVERFKQTGLRLDPQQHQVAGAGQRLRVERTRFQTGVRHLHQLGRQRQVRADEGVNVRLGKLPLSHWDYSVGLFQC